MASSASVVGAARSVRACTECKQAKLRCDSKAKFPNPCSRCETRQLFCTVDAAFQRTPARKRLEAMNRELQELRNRKEGDHVPPSGHGSSVSVEPSPDQGSGSWSSDDFELNVEPMALDGGPLDSALVIEAFKAFTELFRPHFPVLGSVSVHDLYHEQGCLFWTVLMVVASHLPRQDFVDLYVRLVEPYSRYFKDEVLEAPLPLYKIQALLHLCMWPLPVDTQPRDPSWLYYGIAISAARFMGLDREQAVPSLRTLGVGSGTAFSRINTWLGCFYVGNALSMNLGLRPPIDAPMDFSTVQSFLLRRTVPNEFATYVRTQIIVAKYTGLMMQNASEAGSSSVIRLMDNELDTVRSAYPADGPNPTSIEFAVLTTKLHFYVLMVIGLSFENASREMMLKSGLTMALRIIHIASRNSQGRAPELNDQPATIYTQRALPKNYYRSLAFAAIFLLKFFHLNDNAHRDERQAAANHIAMAQEVFKMCSTDPMDEYSRVAKVVELLARLPPDASAHARSRLTHRLGVSILLDAIGTASEVAGKPLEIGEHQTLKEARDIDHAQSQSPPALGPELSFTDEQVDLGVDFLKDYWDDPTMNFHLDGVFPHQMGMG